MKRLLAVLLALFLVLPQTVFAENGGGSEKRIALTFDDGPHPETTEKILTLLSHYGIRATFFVIGENIEYFPDAFRKLASSGMEIGNHTYSHPKLSKESEQSLTEELRRCEELILSNGGSTPTLFRPPEGVRNRVVSAVSDREGYRTVYWSLDTLDWTGISSDSISEKILRGVKENSIILCHDYIVGGGHTVEALARVIPILLSEGYTFVTVSELLGDAN